MTLQELLKKHNGYLDTATASNMGFSRQSVCDFAKRNNLERVAHGVYASEEAWPDEMYVLSLKNSGMVYSHESALYLHGLMEREPEKYTVTVRYGYNATHLRKKGVKVTTAKDEFFNLGVSSAMTVFGNEVTVYNKERTICDIVRNKEKMDIQLFQTAMKEYMKSKDKKIPILMQYAAQLGIESKIRSYTEVLL